MTTTTEIAANVFRISTFFEAFNLGFNQFLVRDEEPLLYHTGMRGLFPLVQEAVAALVDPGTIRWIGFSHFEADECGSLNEWLEIAPNAQAVCSWLGAQVSVNDFTGREAHAMQDGETLSTGSYQFRFLHTPHVPHCWEAGHLFEETQGTLFCSDLLHQNGDVEPLTEGDVEERFRQTLTEYERGPFAHYMPYTKQTAGMLDTLAALQPTTLAPMHGSAYRGDGAAAIRSIAAVLRDVLDTPS